MNFRNIINSIVIVMTLILCFVYAQKKGFTFASGMPKLNWESFPSEKEPKNDNLKKEDNNHPKKDEKIDHKPKEKNEPKQDIKPKEDEDKKELEDKKQEEPQNTRPRLFRRGIIQNCGPGGV